MLEECETGTQEFYQCLVRNRNELGQCTAEEDLLQKCEVELRSMKGAPASASYCVDQIMDYAKCSLNPNTSMCNSQYTQLHECRLRRRRFLTGDDLGLVNLNTMSRKRW